jgi:hypothetical protein
VERVSKPDGAGSPTATNHYVFPIFKGDGTMKENSELLKIAAAYIIKNAVSLGDRFSYAQSQSPSIASSFTSPLNAILPGLGAVSGGYGWLKNLFAPTQQVQQYQQNQQMNNMQQNMNYQMNNMYMQAMQNMLNNFTNPQPQSYPTAPVNAVPAAQTRNYTNTPQTPLFGNIVR